MKFKAKDSEIVANISKDWSADNMKKKTGFNGYVYKFNVGYGNFNTLRSDIPLIHKYFIAKHDVV